MSKHIDYASVEIPEDEDPESWHYTVRRRALLDRIRERGNPVAVNQRQAARDWDVSHTTIQNDMDALAEFMDERIGDRAGLQTKAVYETAVDGLLEAGADGDWRAYKAAFGIVMDWNEWLQETGRQEREPERSEVAVNAQDDDPFTMDPKNMEHFDKLISEAEEACEPCTVHHDNNGNMVADD